MSPDSSLGLPEKVGVIRIPEQYERCQFLTNVVAEKQQADTTHYFSNFLVQFEHFASATQLFNGNELYQVCLSPVQASISGIEAYQSLVQLGLVPASMAGLFLVHQQFPDIFPVGKYVSILDSPLVLPSDRSGNKRTARIRYFWRENPAPGKFVWEFGSGFFDEFLRVGDYVLSLLPVE